MESKIKVAYIIGSLRRGGAETLALNVFKSNCNGVNFLCIYRKKDYLENEFIATGIKLFYIHTYRWNYFYYVFKLRRIIKAENIEIVHTHQTIDSFTSHLATSFLSIPIIQTFHGHGINYSKISRILRFIALKYNDLNIFVSKSQLNYYLKQFKSIITHYTILPNAIDVGASRNNTQFNIKDVLKINKETLLSATVGNFSNGRDQLTVCRFLLLLKQSGIINFHHLFIGSKIASEPWLMTNCIDFCNQNNLSTNVSFLGVRNDVHEILPQLDAFIYSTVHDTFGLAVVEAMSAKTPVFVNDWEAMLEITQNGEYATIYKSRDEQDLMDKFLDFQTNKAKYVEKAYRAAEYVKEKYDIEQYLNKLSAIYKEILFD